MDKDFQFIQELADCLCGISLHLHPDTRQGHVDAVREVFESDFLPRRTEDDLLRSLLALNHDEIYEMEGPVDLQFAFFRCRKTGQLLVVGPCRQGLLTRSQVAQQLQGLHMKPELIRSFADFCMQQPVVSIQTLHRLAVLLAQRLLGVEGPLPFQKLDYRWNVDPRTQLLLEMTDQQVDEIRIIEGRYEASAVLTEAVKRGNLSLAYRFIQRMGTIPEELVRNPNPLRNAQNLCIVLNTQLRHALEEEGVAPYGLDRLSDSIGRKIEQLRTVGAAHGFFGEILQQYCQLAQEKEQKNMSPFARLAVTYIQTHLSDNLTVKDAAKALVINPDYLSAQFHKEVGMPFIAYVNQQRVKQAAGLLRRTQMQIQQIATAVGYNNTSYFAKQFVRFQGMTPRAYRAQSRV